MRILDKKTNKTIKNIILYLTKNEANELRHSLEDLLDNPTSPGDHIHISDESYQKEITVCIYDKNNLEGFDARSVDLIMNDE